MKVAANISSAIAITQRHHSGLADNHGSNPPSDIELRRSCAMRRNGQYRIFAKAGSQCARRASGSAIFFLLATCFMSPLQADLLNEVRANDSAAAVASLASDADINQRMADGTTALHWAVYNGNLDLVRKLIAAGADVNARNDYGSSPMSEAGVLGNAGIIAALLEAGAAVEAPTLEGQTALMSVVRTPHLEAAELLIAHGADVNAFETWRGQTALMFASAQSQPEMVALLLRHGANPDTISTIEAWDRQVTAEPRPQSRPFGGFTALLFAAREGCAACASALLDSGADIDLVDPNGITPLLSATLNARWDVAKILIDAGADVNRWDMWGRAPLYSTVDYNTVPRGGRPDRPSQDMTSPVQVAQLLLQAGANPDMQLKLFPPYRSLGNDRGGDAMLTIGTTPLIRAAKAGDVTMVSLLLQHGALPDLKNWPGYTPLMAAAGLGSSTLDLRARFRHEQQSVEAAQLLLAAGANPDLVDEQGRGPVHGATLSAWPDFIRLLAASGADLNTKDNNGFSPIDYALGRHATGRFASTVQPNEAIAALLLELGAQAAAVE